MTPRFNPPPNWPQPPEGWTPPPGWQPDPNWEPAPVGWRVWLPENTGRRTNGRRVLRWVSITFTWLVFGLTVFVLVAGFVFVLRGGSFSG